MKKLLKIGLGVTFAFILMLSLTGCGKETNKSNNDNKSAQEQKQNGGTQNTNNSENTNKIVVTDGSKLGVLQPALEQQDFTIKGLYINSGNGQHKYEHVDDVETFGVDNYLKKLNKKVKDKTDNE